MNCIVGLGNTGGQYKNTRHNAGFIAIDMIASRYNICVTHKGCGALLGEGDINGKRVILVKPETFMNLSGRAVKAVAEKFNIKIKDLIIVHDDIDLPTGTVKKKETGGDAGHRGIRSIIETLHTKDFFRIRIGVDRPVLPELAADYVLSRFKKDELNIIHESIELVMKIIDERLA